MTRRNFIFPFILLGFFYNTVQAQYDFTSRIDHADSLYRTGVYQQALTEYSHLVEDGYTDPDLLFNAGSAAAQTGDVATAIYYYEHANRYRPSDTQVKKAIRHERQKIENAVVPIESFFLKNWIFNLLTLLRPSLWAFAGLIVLFLGLIKWLQQIKIFSLNTFFNKLPLLFYIGLGIVILLIAVFSYRIIYRADEAILFSACDFRAAPTADSPLSRQLHPGEKVIIQDEVGDFFKVDLLNMDNGWIEKSCVKVIRPARH